MAKTALVLSGGGAKGAFQVGAEKYLREEKGYSWDIIAGVSVGALNGLMLAMGKEKQLWELWNTISADRIVTGGFNLWSLIKVIFGAKSFYGNQPLNEILLRESEPQKIKVDLRVGAVSLITGKYTQFTREDPHLAAAVLASTVMPIVWGPVDVSPDSKSMVDGGVRNASPIGDVLADDLDEVVIINCGSREPKKLPEPPDDIIKIGGRTLDIMLNELFVGDMREFLLINDLVKQAQGQNATLHHPDTGRELKYFKHIIIEPDLDEPLGDTLDFSQASMQRSLKIGEKKARGVFET